MAAPLTCIVGVGACTPVGRSAWSSAAAVRAGVCGFREHPYMVDTAGAPIRIARIPWLHIDVQADSRFAHMLFSAVDEALSTLPRDVVCDRFYLALPEPRPGLPLDLGPALTAAIEDRYCGQFSKVVLFPSGHAAGLLALDAASRDLAQASDRYGMLAAVDSYLMPKTLEWIEACDQLHGAGNLNNAWGFIPGESASALLLHASAGTTACLAQVEGLGLGAEPHRIKSDGVCLGAGLTQALRGALAAVPATDLVDNIFCDMNGEAYRADEYGFSALRMGGRFRAASDFVAPADCWGDVGAAGAALHALLAIASCRKGYARGPLSVVWASSESGHRGALVLRAAVQGRE